MSDDGGDEPDIAEFTSDIENLNKEKHIVPKNKRKSTPRCSKFEFSNLISARLTQIYNDPNGIDNLLVLTDEEKDSVPIDSPDRIEKLVILEIKTGKAPLVLEREMPGPGNLIELWPVNELIFAEDEDNE